MTSMQVTCPKCGAKYLRGVFDGGYPNPVCLIQKVGMA